MNLIRESKETQALLYNIRKSKRVNKTIIDKARSLDAAM